MKKLFLIYVFLLLPLQGFAQEAESESSEPVEDQNLAEEIVVEPEIVPDTPGISLLAYPPPPPPEPPKPIPPDPLAMMKGFGGKSDVGLFSGSLNFDYPLSLPAGRVGMQPSLSLVYSSNERKFGGITGFGWDIPMSQIYRSTEKGIDNLYTQDDFVASVNGQASELLPVDSVNNLYGAKIESNFTKFEFTNGYWLATDTRGWKYYFGQTIASQQVDPNDSTRVYKWLIDRVEEPNGNYMTFTYTKDQGQIYPETIRYTGHANVDAGNYEVKFVLANRPAYTEYQRGFRVVTAKQIKEIEIYHYDSGSPVLVNEYVLDYFSKNNATQLLTGITQQKGSNILPSTNFAYFDGTESETNKKINLLKTINYPYGGIENFTYKPSTAYKVGNDLANKVPFVIHTLFERKLQAGSTDPIHTTQYEYEGGHYYYDNLDAYKKEYAGFHKVAVIDPELNVSRHYFHQSEFSFDGSLMGEYQDNIAKKGREYRIDIFNDSNNLYQTTWQKWDRLVLTDEHPTKERNFVFLSETVTSDFDGDVNARSRAKSFLYDAYGNVTEDKNFGEVTVNDDAGNFTDIGSDLTKEETTYAYNPTDYLVAFPKQIESFDQNNTVIAWQRRHYDLLTWANTDSLTKGNETTRSIRYKTSPDETYELDWNYTLEGNLDWTKDALDNQTTYAYDAKKLQPTQITNAKSQVSHLTYDYRFGQVSESEDPNGHKFITVYDDFGRAIETKVTSPSNTAIEVTQSQTVFDLVNQPVSITQKLFTQNAGIVAESINYLDGLGRGIQTRTESESPNFVVKNTVYDSRGNVAKEILPVHALGSAFETIDANGVGNSFAYDPLGRQTQISNVLGTTNIVYDQWEVQTTDSENNRRDLLYDGRERLVGVREYLGGTPYTTDYVYNTLDQLIQIEDALGNQKDFTYNLAGWKLSESDFHRVVDTTVGIKNFTYDLNGDLLSRTDAKAQTVNWTYDELRRILTEDDPSETGIEVTYTYDSGTNGIGRLSSIDAPDSDKNFTYDSLGRATEIQQTIDGQTFNLNFTYDLLGQPLNITYPNGNVANYTYNSAGQLSGVSSGIDPVVSNIDYAPTGSVSQIDFANGVTTQNTYDVNQLYRLTNKLTQYGTTKLQNLAYTYDSVGNITQIVDGSDTNTAKTTIYTYDDLYRLIQAVVSNSANNTDYSRTYTYDIIGNMLTRSDVGSYSYAGNVSSTSSGTNATPHAVTDVAGTTYLYDDNGNLVSDSVWTHAWDYQDRLESSTNGTDTINYQYDETRDRVLKHNTVTGKKTYYIDKYYDLEDTTAKAHIFAGNTKIATHKTDMTQ